MSLNGAYDTTCVFRVRLARICAVEKAIKKNKLSPYTRGKGGLQYILENKLQYALFLSRSVCLLYLALLRALSVCHSKAMFTSLSGVARKKENEKVSFYRYYLRSAIQTQFWFMYDRRVSTRFPVDDEKETKIWRTPSPPRSV